MNLLKLQSIRLTVMVLLASGGLYPYSQAQATPQVMPAAMPDAIQDPTRPEVQPRLDIDRDPIPSPDPDIPSVRALPSHFFPPIGI
jgi:hypothetical protein